MVLCKTFKALSKKEWFEIVQLRSDVFLIEQSIKVSELDENDLTCAHYFIKQHKTIVSYARLIKGDNNHQIGRVCTKKIHRGKGYSKKIIEAMKKRHDVLIMSAQVAVIPFYESLGFKLVGNRYLDAGIIHQKMKFVKKSD